MTMIYSNPAREQEAGALPDVEVFEAIDAKCSACYVTSNIAAIDLSGHCPACNEPNSLAEVASGWYWQACFPGCLPDGEPYGPFATEAEAVADAQANALEDEPELIVFYGWVPHDGCPNCATEHRTELLGWYWQYPGDDAHGPLETEADARAQKTRPTWHIVRVNADGTEYAPRRIYSGYGDASALFEATEPKAGEAVELWYSDSSQVTRLVRACRDEDDGDVSELPPCVLAMGCYCAGHARGNPASAPCDTHERADGAK